MNREASSRQEGNMGERTVAEPTVLHPIANCAGIQSPRELEKVLEHGLGALSYLQRILATAAPVPILDWQFVSWLKPNALPNSLGVLVLGRAG